MAGQQKTRVAEVGGSWAQDETRTYITARPNITSSGYHCAPIGTTVRSVTPPLPEATSSFARFVKRVGLRRCRSTAHRSLDHSPCEGAIRSSQRPRVVRSFASLMGRSQEYRSLRV